MPSRPVPANPSQSSLISKTRFVFLILTISTSLVIFFAILFFIYHFWHFLFNRSRTNPFHVGDSMKLRRFSQRELKIATNDFDDSNVIGKGGSGTVFRGIAGDGKLFAVKRLDNLSIQTETEFQNELQILGGLRSPFLVTLLGYCVEKNHRLLVYEYMPNKCLQELLFGENGQLGLNWERRFSIILDVAKALEFMHFGCDPPVIHGDIKPSNVLLDSEFRAKVSDFGLSRIKVEGEFGVDLFSQDLGKSQELSGNLGTVGGENTPHDVNTPTHVVDFALALQASSSSKNKSKTCYSVRALSLNSMSYNACIALEGENKDGLSAKGKEVSNGGGDDCHVNKLSVACDDEFYGADLSKELNLSPNSVLDGKELNLSPNSVLDDGELNLSPNSVLYGKELNLSPNSVLAGGELNLSPNSVLDGKELSLSPNSVLDGNELNLSPNSVLDGKELNLSPISVLEGNKMAKQWGKDWWWKQEGNGELCSKDYVREWIGSQIYALNPIWDDEQKSAGKSELESPSCRLNKSENGNEAGFDTLEEEFEKEKMNQRKKDRKKKHRKMQDWWKEERLDDMSKRRRKKFKILKTKFKKVLKIPHFDLGRRFCFLKRKKFPENIQDDCYTEGEFSFRRGWRRKNSGKSMGSEMWSGDLFSRELSSTTSMRGTLCYIAPEYGGFGYSMEKGDIYSLGVLILVIVSGRRPLHVLASPMKLEKANLVSWCRHLAQSGNVLELIDERLRDEYNKEQASLCISLALACLQKSPELRPDIGEVVRILKGEMEIPMVPFEFSPSPPPKTYSRLKWKT